MVKVVIFDLDDTLISENEYVKSGYYHIAEIINKRYAIDKKQIFNDLMELSRENSENVFNRYFDKHKIVYSKDMIMNLVDQYRGHSPKIIFYEDVSQTLKELKKLNIKTGIITDGYSVAQRQKLKAINAEKLFDEIIVTDELGKNHWKPHPKSFELMKRKFNVDFDEIIYVGDNPEKDFYISKTYPIKTVRILREGLYNNKMYLEDIKEDFTINNLEEIIELFD